MKICPWCESGYPDELIHCPLHGGLLSEIRDLKPGMLVRNTYRIVRRLSKGGMSNVYLAQHVLLNEPQVLKFLSPELSRNKDWTSRFLREVRTLRQIRHKNVVHASNVEPAEDGTLFFSMEYVEGPDLLEFYRRAPQPFDVGLALEIVHDIAKGLGAAHALGVVHRDIKPENILIAIEEDTLVPKIADFGIVATAHDSRLTQTGNALLTPQFAAPEQWMGKGTAEIDGRTDFYALGGLLFELLTGRSSFKGENNQDWAQQHINAPVPRPSDLRPDLQDWQGLDELVLRLLAKDPRDRPADSAEVLQLIDSVKHAPKPAPPMRELPASEKASQTDADAGLNVIANEDAIEPGPLKIWDTARTQPAISGRKGQIRSRKTRTRDWLISAILISLSAAAWYWLKNSVDVRVLSQQQDAIFSLAFAPNGIELSSASRDNTVQFWDIPDGRALGTISAATTALAFSPDGHTISTGMADNSINIWDAHRNSLLSTLTGHKGRVSALAFSADGHNLASASWDQTVRYWDVSTGRLLHTFSGDQGRVFAVACSPDSQILASAGEDQIIRIWDLSKGTLIRTLQGHEKAVNSLAFSADGTTLASGGDDMTIRIWNVTAGQAVRTLRGHTGPVLSLSFGPTGRNLASGGADATVRLWDLRTGEELHVLKGHSGAVLSTAFSPFGTIVASGGEDKTIRLWTVSGARD